jgi:hypothetical protein
MAMDRLHNVCGEYKMGSSNSRRLQNHVALEFVRAIINKSNLPSRVSAHNADYAQTDRFPQAKS